MTQETFFLPKCKHLCLRCPTQQEAQHLGAVIFEINEPDTTPDQKKDLLDELVVTNSRSRRFFLSCQKTGKSCRAYPCGEWSTIPASLLDVKSWENRIAECPSRLADSKLMQSAEGWVLAHFHDDSVAPAQ